MHQSAEPRGESDTSSVDENALVRLSVAANMRRARLARGLSLREMAAQTGLSKALLSQIEREVANPTVAALTRVAQALDLTFAELTRSSLSEPLVIRGADRASTASGGRLLFSMMDRRRFDLSEGILVPGQPGVFSDHGRGSIEYGYVVSGAVTLTIGARTFELGEGDAIRFAAELQHAYSVSTGSATLLTVVAYADE